MKDVKYFVTFFGAMLLVALLVLSGCAAPEKGERGETGAQGVAGRDGISGTDGADGKNGIDAEEFALEVIDPCGKTAKRADEVVLRLMDGTILGTYRHGGTNFLTVLAPGMHETLDGSGCRFIVDDDGRVSW